MRRSRSAPITLTKIALVLILAALALFMPHGSSPPAASTTDEAVATKPKVVTGLACVHPNILVPSGSTELECVKPPPTTDDRSVDSAAP